MSITNIQTNEEHYFDETSKNSNLYKDFNYGSYYIVQSLDNRYSVSLIETLPQAIQEAKELGEPCIIIEQKYTPICYVGIDIVRCKDCVSKGKAKVNSKGFLICPDSGMEICDDDYCSYGEQREINDK